VRVGNGDMFHKRTVLPGARMCLVWLLHR